MRRSVLTSFVNVVRRYLRILLPQNSIHILLRTSERSDVMAEPELHELNNNLSIHLLKLFKGIKLPVALTILLNFFQEPLKALN